MDKQLEDAGARLRRYLRQLAKVLDDQQLNDAADHIDHLELRVVETEYALELQRAKANPEIAEAEFLQKLEARDCKPRPGTPVPLEQRAGPIARQLMQEATLRSRALRDSALSNLGDSSLLAFFILVEEAEEWGGEPCVGASAAPGLRGALPHLRRAGLLTTYTKEDGSARGFGTYVRFTGLANEVLEQLRAGE